MSESDDYIVHAAKIAKGVDVPKDEELLTIEDLLEFNRRSKRLD